ncbi:MAG: lytic transglycosylase domain-containing protein [Desulfobacteraceae bacterium]
MKTKRADLYEKYKKELTSGKKDDRLDPSLSIASGYLYFSRLMKSRKGDISLALASYNAEPRRVRETEVFPL